MALTSQATGTTTTDGTEQTLVSANATAGVWIFVIDTTNLANGDAIELRVKAKVLTGGSVLLIYLVSYAHAQSEPVKISVPVPSLYAITITLKRVAGTDRAYDWNAMTL